MDAGTAALVVAAAAGAAAAFAVYRWRLWRRARRVDAWVRDYLARRFGGAPGSLHIDCSDDELWPVLVTFDDPDTGARRRLRFVCPGPGFACSLVSDDVDALSAALTWAAEDRTAIARFEDDGGRGQGQSDWENRLDEFAAARAAQATRR